jgi:hypothetical protein
MRHNVAEVLCGFCLIDKKGNPVINKIKAAVAIGLFAVSAIASAVTVDQFNAAVEKLGGKSKDEVFKILGKPAGYMTQGDFEMYRFEGIQDPYTGKASTGSLIVFKNGRLDATQKPRHFFDKIPF